MCELLDLFVLCTLFCIFMATVLSFITKRTVIKINTIDVKHLFQFQGKTIDAEHLSELTEEEYEVNFMKSNLKGFVKLDVKYLIPFFTRRFTHQVIIIYFY